MTKEEYQKRYEDLVGKVMILFSLSGMFLTMANYAHNRYLYGPDMKTFDICYYGPELPLDREWCYGTEYKQWATFDEEEDMWYLGKVELNEK